MPPAPLHPNESRRIETLLACNVLDTGAEREFDDLTALAARLCGAPIALVSLVDTDRQWFKSRVGLDATQTPRSQAFCAYTILSREPLVVEDATTDPRTLDNPLVTGEPHIRFYAGHPLALSNGDTLGSLCVIDFEPRAATPAMLADLEAIAVQVSTQLELRMRLTELERAHARAHEADAAKSRFLASMSHEIRTPMTAILGFAELLEREGGLDDHARRHAIHAIRTNGDHLLGLINDVLDLSKIEAGHLSLERIPTDPGALLDDVADMLRVRAEAKGLRLRIVREGPLPAGVSTDPTRLRQILINLASNAIKFTERGSVTIGLRTIDDPARLEFTVEDTGVGMSPDQLERINQFRPFQQADASVTRRFGGTGLGLCISASLARALGGSLELQSEPGAGTTATATIPILDAGAPASPAAEPRHQQATANADAAPLAGRRILLAEDGLDNQFLIRFHLEAAGAEVVIVDNGQAALDAIDRGERFDVVLMDMQMPILDGYGAASRLRDAGCPLPVIAITAHAMAEDRQRCLDAGCHDYLTKPINAPALVERCRAWSERRAVA